VQKLDKSWHFVESEIEFAIANCSEKVQITTKIKLSVKDSFVSFSVQSFGRPFLKLCEVRGDRDLGRDGLSSSRNEKSRKKWGFQGLRAIAKIIELQ
jgi:hypothetical protein